MIDVRAIGEDRLLLFGTCAVTQGKRTGTLPDRAARSMSRFVDDVRPDPVCRHNLRLR
jgi:hypothetical protein